MKLDITLFLHYIIKALHSFMIYYGTGSSCLIAGTTKFIHSIPNPQIVEAKTFFEPIKVGFPS